MVRFVSLVTSDPDDGVRDGHWNVALSFSQLTRLITREDLIDFGHRENFKSYILSPLFRLGLSDCLFCWSADSKVYVELLAGPRFDSAHHEFSFHSSSDSSHTTITHSPMVKWGHVLRYSSAVRWTDSRCYGTGNLAFFPENEESGRMPWSWSRSSN
jgi:hypothetical protein